MTSEQRMLVSQLPDDWTENRLGDLCLGKGAYGANVPKSPFDPCLPRYVRITDISPDGRLLANDLASIGEQAAAPHLLEPGDVLLARSGATVGKSYVHDARYGRCAHAGYLIRFRTQPNLLLPTFLKHFLQSPVYWQWVAETQRAQAQPNINAAEYAALLIPTPPLKEQRKIAAILSVVDDAIESTQAVIDQLGVVKKAMMAELLTRGLPGRHTRFKRTEIGQVPEGWDVVSLDSCIQPDRPICYGILMPGKGHPGGVPVVKVKDIKNGVIDERDILLTTPELDEQYRRSRLREGDVLLTIRGTTGRVARVPANLDRANITQDTARLSVRSGVDRDYVYFVLQGELLQRQIQDHTRGQAVKGINIGDVRRLFLPLPALAEQIKMAKIFASLDENTRLNSGELASLRVVKSALLSVLLTGEVRVKPDEDAS